MDELICLIKSYENNNFDKRGWKNLLSSKYKNWKKLLKEPNNWKLLDELKSVNNSDKLYELIIDVVGPELASYWFNSKIKEQKLASRKWLKKFSKNPSVEFWNKLNYEARNYITKDKFYGFKIRFIPNDFERKLIAYLLDKFRKNGYKLIALPEILLSYEIPPIFLIHPDEKIKEEIRIEELLGCYIADLRSIILYDRGIYWLSKRYKFDSEKLRAVVLIHEIAHWISHLLPKTDSPEWPIQIYKLTSDEVHEGWAQLITYLVVSQTDKNLLKVFENLNKIQSDEYRVFEKFKNKDESKIILSLEKLRSIGFPATLEDWEGLM
ncbi:MAG: hypothetical protein ABIL49_03080 [candidate division WOR-3 bacterium]|jgi:hypothetical protein